MKKGKTEYKKLAKIAAMAASSKKAFDIALYDLNGSSIAYFVLIISVNSAPQMNAAFEAVEKTLKKEGAYSLHRDGEKSKTWKVMDFGGLIIHAFDEETRQFYSLDRIYHENKKMNWKTSRKKKKISHVKSS